MQKRSFSPLAALLVLAVAFAAGCAGTKAAYTEADTLDEYAYVITEHYASLLREAANLKEKPTTPAAAVEAMQRADMALHLVIVGNSNAVPAVPGLAELAATYQRLKDAKSEAELQEAVNTAILRIADLQRAVKAARETP